MTQVAYAVEATTGKYEAAAFGYIRDNVQAITNAASKLGISAGVIAGAMVEENSDYQLTQTKNDAADWYAIHRFTTHLDWLADYVAVGGDTGYAPTIADKALHPIYTDLS